MDEFEICHKIVFVPVKSAFVRVYCTSIFIITCYIFLMKYSAIPPPVLLYSKILRSDET